MFCNNCGKQIQDNSAICVFCGARQDAPAGGISSPVNYKQAAGSINIFVIIAAIVLALGTLLPCYSIKTGLFSDSMSYIEGDGIFVLLAAIAVGVLAAVRKEKFACIPAAIAIIVLIVFAVNMADAKDSMFGGAIKTGIGVYVMWIGAIGSAVLPFVKTK